MLGTKTEGGVALHVLDVTVVFLNGDFDVFSRDIVLIIDKSFGTFTGRHAVGQAHRQLHRLVFFFHHFRHHNVRLNIAIGEEGLQGIAGLSKSLLPGFCTGHRTDVADGRLAVFIFFRHHKRHFFGIPQRAAGVVAIQVHGR